MIEFARTTVNGGVKGAKDARLARLDRRDRPGYHRVSRSGRAALPLEARIFSRNFSQDSLIQPHLPRRLGRILA